MGLNDLDKIIIHKTVMGINCPKCGGDLQPSKAGFAAKAFVIVTLGTVKMNAYKCSNCKKAFNIF